MAGYPCMKMHVYTDEQKRFLIDNHELPNKDLAALFNEKFGLNQHKDSIHSWLLRRGCKKTNTGRIEKGNIPWNKGLKGFPSSSPSTCFKSGNLPVNHRPVKSERINKDGLVEIKIAEPRKWKSKHSHIYEQHHGPIPKGHLVIFLDKNNRNFDIDNLALISRSVNGLMTNQGSHDINDPEIKRTLINVHKIESKICGLSR